MFFLDKLQAIRLLSAFALLGTKMGDAEKNEILSPDAGLRELRDYLDVTVQEAARELGRSVSWLSSVERGYVPVSDHDRGRIRSAIIRAARAQARQLNQRLREVRA